MADINADMVHRERDPALRTYLLSEQIATMRKTRKTKPPNLTLFQVRMTMKRLWNAGQAKVSVANS
jgi:hypothetical protein